MRVPKQSVPLFVGVTVLGLGVSLGYNTGYVSADCGGHSDKFTNRFNLSCAINPARDLSPRVFTLLAGWGSGVFTEYNHW